jgi:adenylate cyclase, class 2
MVMFQALRNKVMAPERVLAHPQETGTVWSAPVDQDDQAYAVADWNFGNLKTGRRFARLRTAGDTHSLTLKIPQSNVLACLEFESGVDDREAVHGMLVAVGDRPTVRIRKRRWTAAYLGYTLCLDDVQGLGCFMEAEAMTTADADAHVVQSGLRACLEATLLPVQDEPAVRTDTERPFDAGVLEPVAGALLRAVPRLEALGAPHQQRH